MELLSYDDDDDDADDVNDDNDDNFGDHNDDDDMFYSSQWTLNTNGTRGG